MDIAGLSMAMSQNDTMTQVGAAMMGKQLDTMDTMAGGLIASMNAMPSPSLESMVNPAVGQSIDLLV